MTMDRKLVVSAGYQVRASPAMGAMRGSGAVIPRWASGNRG